MYYINAISSITHQDSFDKLGISTEIDVLGMDTALIDPDYKKYIDPKMIRRMSKILRMGVACSYNCLERSGVDSADAIIVGTGLGCLTDTMKFLDTYISIEGLLPPTSFIQSTHNTIAGQISLAMGNHGYNTTYTQNNISFELALEDAMISLDEGLSNVLVGAADEFIPFFKETPFAHLNLTSGATFMMLSSQQQEQTLAKVTGTKTRAKVEDIDSALETFLLAHGITKDQLDKLYFSTPFNEEAKDLKLHYSATDINELVGIYPTNAAFAIHLAADEIATGKANNIVICNNLTKHNLGLTLIQAI